MWKTKSKRWTGQRPLSWKNMAYVTYFTLKKTITKFCSRGRARARENNRRIKRSGQKMMKKMELNQRRSRLSGERLGENTITTEREK